MPTAPPPFSPHYVEYTRLLRELHALIRGGRGDSEQADEIRDAMDGPWGLLTPAEAELAKKLSADLNATPQKTPASTSRRTDDGITVVANGEDLERFSPLGG
jgi:hypothetical protein